jgi:hypothetical protein
MRLHGLTEVDGRAGCGPRIPPLSDALLELWQADAAGLYNSPLEARGQADPADACHASTEPRDLAAHLRNALAEFLVLRFDAAQTFNERRIVRKDSDKRFTRFNCSGSGHRSPLSNKLLALLPEDEYKKFMEGDESDGIPRNNPWVLNMMLKVSEQFKIAQKSGLSMKSPESAMASLNTVEAVDARLNEIRNHPTYVQVVQARGIDNLAAQYRMENKHAEYMALKASWDSLNAEISPLTQKKLKLQGKI